MIFDTPVDRKCTHSSKWAKLPAEDCVPMCIADMDFFTPPPISRALIERAKHSVYGYTDYSETFFETIISWVQRHYRWQVQEDWITMSNGVVSSLCTAIRALTNESDRIIVQSPVYSPFFHVINNNNRVVVENPLLLEDGKYHMDFQLLSQQVKDARLLILCSPHNPVGRVWMEEELSYLGQLCRDNGIIIISDDIHCDITLKQQYISLASLSEDLAEICITSLSPSKTFNIAGLNMSYEIIPNPEIRKKIRHEKTASGANISNLFGITAMERAYRDCDEWLKDLLQYLNESLSMIREHFSRIEQIDLIEPEGTYLAWLDCRRMGKTSDELMEYFLQEAGIRLQSGRIFGTPGEGFLRMNYATSHAVLNACLSRISEAIHIM